MVPRGGDPWLATKACTVAGIGLSDPLIRAIDRLVTQAVGAHPAYPPSVLLGPVVVASIAAGYLVDRVRAGGRPGGAVPMSARDWPVAQLTPIARARARW